MNTHAHTPPQYTHNLKINFYFKERARERKGKGNIAWWYLIFVLAKSVLFCEVLRPEIKETENRMGIRFGDPSVPLEPALIVWMSHSSKGVHV